MFASLTACSSDLLTSLDFNNKEKNKAMLPYGDQVSGLLTTQMLSIKGYPIQCTLMAS